MATRKYDHQAVETHWQKAWEDAQLFQQSEAVAGSELSEAEKKYILFAFAYPSGSGLHVGHVESKTALDILSRYYRMNGQKVFFPVGWDAFGLPAENYAIKTGVHPSITTKNAIDTFRQQIKRIGISYDWANEIATNHPGYYQWTQWIFLQLFKKGLAYRDTGMVNWCPSCQTVLANEQVVDGTCERCGSTVIQKDLVQWYFKITEYKDELISGLDQVDWPESTKQHQLDWIGRGKGMSIDFALSGTKSDVKQNVTVWTKFWETVFGVTFVVIAPEKFEELALLDQVPQEKVAAIKEYLDQTKRKTEEERKVNQKEKSGVDTGLTVINPVNGQAVPLFVADYVLMGVGTAVVMGVPSHDQRDFEFAEKFGLPKIQVVSYKDKAINDAVKAGQKAHEGEGVLVNSSEFDGMSAWGEGKTKLAEWLNQKGYGRWETTYKLRDWLISRQRYWGAPIPVVYDPEGKAHPVKEEHLPWLLPTDVEFKPTGESPLTHSKEFIERTERLYGKGWRPEFDTMDTFVDSSWYFLRYLDSRNTKAFADPAKLAEWLPVDLYMIGPEHIVLHLLYARFFTKFLRDEGYLKFDEPFMKMRHQGMILGPDGKKMSKSKGNVINPDEIIEKFGADTLRVYEMFMGPLEADKPWSTTAVAGLYRFLNRIYAMVMAHKEFNGKVDAKSEVNEELSQAARQALHRAIKKVSQDIPKIKFNTAIASLMEFINAWEKAPQALSQDEVKSLVKILAPFAPFMADELYHQLGETEFVHVASWPTWDEALTQANQISVPVQINGKLRDQLVVSPDKISDQAWMIEQAQQLPKVKTYLDQSTVKKSIYVPGRVINLVIELK